MYESFCRKLMLSSSFASISTLIQGELPKSLRCASSTLLSIEAKLLQTAGLANATPNHLHASRTKEDILCAMCLNSNSYLGCKHGVLHNPLPCIFMGIYSPKSDDAVEDGPDALVLKISFEDSISYDEFLNSEKSDDALLRYLDRATDACRCIKQWLISHSIENKYEEDRLIEASAK